MEIFFGIMAILGLLVLCSKHFKEREEEKKRELIKQAEQRREERMAKMVLDYKAKLSSIERGEDFYTTSDGFIKVKRSYLDANFMQGAFMDDDIFFAMEDNEGYITLTKEQFDNMHTRKQEYEQRQEKLFKTAELNNIGMEQEKTGNIEQAIATYEECIKIGYPASHAYDRLLVIYRKRKDYDNEERVCKLAIEAFKTETKYQDRLSKIESLKKQG